MRACLQSNVEKKFVTLSGYEKALLAKALAIYSIVACSLGWFYYQSHLEAIAFPSTSISQTQLDEYPMIYLTFVPIISPDYAKDCQYGHSANNHWYPNRTKIQFVFASGPLGSPDNFFMNAFTTPWKRHGSYFLATLQLPFVFVFNSSGKFVRHLDEEYWVPCSILDGVRPHCDKGKGCSYNATQDQEVCATCFSQGEKYYRKCPRHSLLPSAATFFPRRWNPKGDNEITCKGTPVNSIMMIPGNTSDVAARLETLFQSRVYDPTAALVGEFPEGVIFDNTEAARHVTQYLEFKVSRYQRVHDEAPQSNISIERTTTPGCTGVASNKLTGYGDHLNVFTTTSTPHATTISEHVAITRTCAFVQWATAMHGALALVVLLFPSSVKVPLHFAYGPWAKQYNDFLHYTVHEKLHATPEADEKLLDGVSHE